MPLPVLAGSSKLFFIAMPRSIDMGMPETGIANAEDKAAAEANPPPIVAIERPIPGTKEGYDEEHVKRQVRICGKKQAL